MLEAVEKVCKHQRGQEWCYTLEGGGGGLGSEGVFVKSRVAFPWRIR